jgi:hypothetical protein
MADDYVEPWLRGPLEGVHPLLAPTLHAYAQAREDIAKWTDGLSDAEIWQGPHGLAPVGFHLRHIAGSVERLTAYLRGEELTPEQLDALRREMDPGPGRSDLLAKVNEAFRASGQAIQAIDPATFADSRSVGRKHLPATVIGLVIHLAEHTQRHVGELIVTSKLSKLLLSYPNLLSRYPKG